MAERPRVRAVPMTPLEEHEADIQEIHNRFAVVERLLVAIIEDIHTLADAVESLSEERDLTMGEEPEDDRDYEPGYDDEALHESVYAEEAEAIRAEADEEEASIEAEAAALESASMGTGGADIDPGDAAEIRESEQARARRIREVRERRKAALRVQGVRDFEEGNESPEAAMTDPNDIMDLPEEGITVDPGRDPWGRSPEELSDTADPAGEYDER